jgi:hypothetical protein
MLSARLLSLIGFGACPRSNKALQMDNGRLSCLLHSQKPRQLAFAAELDR